jgi:hypothetical protein
MQSDRLIDREQFMESIHPPRAYVQTEVNLRERSHRHGHGRMIVKRDEFFSMQVSGNSRSGGCKAPDCRRRTARHVTSVISTVIENKSTLTIKKIPVMNW